MEKLTRASANGKKRGDQAKTLRFARAGGGFDSIFSKGLNCKFLYTLYYSLNS